MSYVHCPRCSRAFNLERVAACPECATAPLPAFALVAPPPPPLDPTEAIVAAAEALARAIELATPSQLAAARERIVKPEPLLLAAPPRRRRSLRDTARQVVRELRAIVAAAAAY